VRPRDTHSDPSACMSPLVMPPPPAVCTTFIYIINSFKSFDVSLLLAYNRIRLCPGIFNYYLLI
jgi:hypothetical protein